MARMAQEGGHGGRASVRNRAPFCTARRGEASDTTNCGVASEGHASCTVGEGTPVQSVHGFKPQFPHL